MEPQEIKGTCILGLVYNPEISSVAGDYARAKPQKDKSGVIANTVYYQLNEGVKSNNLETVLQASGGILPKVNKNIGASLCTFIKGYFAPDGTSAHFPLIKGPSKMTNFGNEIGSWEYNPLPLVAPATIPAPGSQPVFGPSATVIKSPNNNNYLVIPSKPDINYPQAKTPLTTWNIWEPININGIGAGVGVATNQTFRYQPQWGILYPTSLTQEQQDVFCFATPSFGEGMGDAYIYCPSPNKSTTIKRMFPISCDIAYRFENLNHKPQIFYPPEPEGVPAPAPQDIMSTGGVNCGFQMHFQFPKLTVNASNSNTNNTDGIYIYWGSLEATDPTKQIIETFYLQLTPGENPMLYFLNPLTNLWDNYPLQNSPVFGVNGETSFSVYVHFVGPVMLIGFNSANTNVEWFAFNPISLTSPLVPNVAPSKFYPYVSAQAQIYLTLTNISVSFRYGAIAFNNYDADGVSLWNKLNQNLSTGEKYNCRLNTQFLLPNRKKDQVTETQINDQFHDGRVRNPVADNLVPSLTKSNQPTFYADWRKIVDKPNKTGYELNWEQVAASSTTTNTNNQQLLLSGRVVWDTTIEGPLYLHVDSRPTNADVVDDLLRSVLDVSEFLTQWNVTYGYDDSEQNHGYMNGGATVTLKDFATTPQGRAALTLMEGNIFGITLAAGIDETVNYFQGVIRSIKTTYEKSGSTTILTCTDLMTEILDNTLFKSSFRIDGFNYLTAVEYLIDCGSLKPWYVQETDPDFLTFYSNLNLGVPYLDSSSGSRTYVCQLSDVISDMVKIVMAHFVDPEYPAVLYWNPIKKKVTLDARFKEDNRDVLLFYGYTDENMLSFLPTDLDGVIGEGGYTITTDTSNIHSGLILTAKGLDGEPVTSYPPPNNASSPELYDELSNQLATLEISDNDLSYVGWDKTKYMDLQNLQIKTRQDLDTYNAVFTNNFVRNAYSQINFNVFINQPLHPQGIFAVQTFLPNISEEQIQNTDWYRYKSLEYTYTKRENKIMAAIVGENFPPSLLITTRIVDAGRG